MSSHNWGWDWVTATLDGITHSARHWQRINDVTSLCGVSCNQTPSHAVCAVSPDGRVVDCMSCLVIQARREASYE